jgi:hypothetical protein
MANTAIIRDAYVVPAMFAGSKTGGDDAAFVFVRVGDEERRKRWAEWDALPAWSGARPSWAGKHSCPLDPSPLRLAPSSSDSRLRLRMDIRERRGSLDRYRGRADLGLHRIIRNCGERSSRQGREVDSVHTRTIALGCLGGDRSRRVGCGTGHGKATGLTSQTVVAILASEVCPRITLQGASKDWTSRNFSCFCRRRVSRMAAAN